MEIRLVWMDVLLHVLLKLDGIVIRLLTQQHVLKFVEMGCELVQKFVMMAIQVMEEDVQQIV